MSIKQAALSDLSLVKRITETTISEIYPHYYPQGAVEFFLSHHSESAIAEDIKRNRVFLCFKAGEIAVGTITIKENEIGRLFVLPEVQGRGYGTRMLDYAEELISRQYRKAVLAASLPAKRLYQKRGYKDADFHIIPVKNNDFLCYDVCVKTLERQIHADRQDENGTY